MLQADYLALLDVRDCDELRSALVYHANRAGFETVVATSLVADAAGDAGCLCVHNTPADYCSAFDDREAGRRDPVMQYIKRHSLPIAWDRHTYENAGQEDLWEEQAPYGFVSGLALAMHLPGGRHFLFGYDRDQDLPSHTAEVARMVADFQLLAVYAQDAAFRLLLPPPPKERDQPPDLTPRELECLRWTMEGKTAWELGMILGISEHTAVRHIFNASRKLGCSGKMQAVIRALRLGLIP